MSSFETISHDAFEQQTKLDALAATSTSLEDAKSQLSDAEVKRRGRGGRRRRRGGRRARAARPHPTGRSRRRVLP